MPSAGQRLTGSGLWAKARSAGKPSANYAGGMNLHSLADLPARLQHPQVRDLAWTLLSPPLLRDTPSPQRHPLAASRWNRHPGELADWLLHQDRQASVLQTWLAQSSIRRLGLYYERLWQYALCHAPDVQLLVANLPIRCHGQTLGELDLLTRDAEGVHHVELAVKFYLGLDSGNCSQYDHWLGPGSHDRLDIKLARLCQHQLPLASETQARAVLAELTCCKVTSVLWLGGYLFRPWPVGCQSPGGVNPAHLRGRWLRRRDWANFLDSEPATHWQPLPRPTWLAPARLQLEDIWPHATFDNWLNELPARHPAQLLARFERDGNGHWIERERLFMVADGWPHATDATTASAPG